MNKIVTVKKKHLSPEIKLDVSRIVAITDVDQDTETYTIFFEFAYWTVQADSYEEVYKTWSEYVQH